MNTSCQNCYFSDKASSSQACQFDIVNQIKDEKNISIKNDYYYIENYSCRYGFSRTQYETNKKDLEDIDLKQYILEKQLVSYYLIIDHRENISIKNICENINKLQIKPKFISIFCYEANIGPYLDDLNKYLDNKLKWKTHNFLTKTTSTSLAIKTALDTATNLSDINYIWINKSDQIQNLIESNAIEKINYIVNIQQPVCNFVKSKFSDNLYTVFLNTQTYQYITKNINQMLEDGIKQIDTTSIYYDN